MSGPLSRHLGLVVLVVVVLGAALVGLLMPSLRTHARDVTIAASTNTDASASAEAVPVVVYPDPVDRDEDRQATAGPARKQTLRLRPDSGAILAAARMPASTDIVAVVERAAELRQSMLGAAAAQFFADAEGLAQSRNAWSSLAQKLGWSEAETFDRLLGRRIVLVARAAPDGQSMLWVLLSDISLETDQRLKERLAAAQRAIDQGHQILSIENGAYELTSHRREPRPGSRADSEARASGIQPTVTIVLGPGGGQSSLFDEMVGVLASGAGESLAGEDVLAEAGKAGASDILLLARIVPQPKPGESPAPIPPADAPRWANFITFAARRTDPAGSELEARVVYRDTTESAQNLTVAPSSDTVFRALEPDSLLTVVQAAPVQGILGRASTVLDALRQLPLPDEARSALGQRKILSVRRLPAFDAPAVQTMQAENFQNAAPASPPPSRCAAVIAMEAASTRDLARSLDGSIARFVNGLEQGAGQNQPPPHNFAGELPQITRVLPVRSGEGNLVRLLTPDPLTFAWSYPRVEPTDDSAGQGWWVLTVSPAPASRPSLPTELQRDMVAAITTPPDALAAAAEARRWVWLGAGRPAELERLLPSVVPDLAGFRTAMQRFDRLRFELSINEVGDIQGDVALRLLPAQSLQVPQAR